MQDVDHNKHRQKIAAIAVEVIASEGMDAATVRNIAARAGCSTTLITHYFNDKDELLLLAYRHISTLAVERLEAVTARDPADVLGALLAMVPVDEHSLKGWRVYVAFWQKAGHDPEFAAEQHQWIQYAHDQIAARLRAAIGDQPGISQLTRHLLALVHGIAVQNLFDAQCWSADSVRDTLSREVAFLLGQVR